MSLTRSSVVLIYCFLQIYLCNNFQVKKLNSFKLAPSDIYSRERSKNMLNISTISKLDRMTYGSQRIHDQERHGHKNWFG